MTSYLKVVFFVHSNFGLWMFICVHFTFQDAIDLFLGNYVVEESEGVTKPSPLRPERDWKVYAVSVVSLELHSCL